MLAHPENREVRSRIAPLSLRHFSTTRVGCRCWRLKRLLSCPRLANSAACRSVFMTIFRSSRKSVSRDSEDTRSGTSSLDGASEGESQPATSWFWAESRRKHVRRADCFLVVPRLIEEHPAFRRKRRKRRGAAPHTSSPSSFFSSSNSPSSHSPHAHNTMSSRYLDRPPSTRCRSGVSSTLSSSRGIRSLYFRSTGS